MSVKSAPTSQPTATTWFSAAEIADMRLAGLPHDKRSINALAREERWASRLGSDGELLVRKRAGRGGGAEYHVSLLPGETRLELARRGIIQEQPEPIEDQRAARWEWFDRQKSSVKQEARARLEVLSTVQTLQQSGATQTVAVAAASEQFCKGKSTILGWLKLVRGLERTDWLPALATDYKGGGVKAEIDDDLWTYFRNDYLRPSAPTLTSAYDRVAAIAAERGLSIPAERTFRRRLDREVAPEVILLKREGVEALERTVPANRRTVADLHALEWVNIDGHRFDVFVTPPPMHRSTKPIRPMLVAIQDVYSRKFLSWRLGCEESAIQTRLAFADLFRDWGIPHHALLDNSRAFASKWITGGARTRFRFKVKHDEPVGLLAGVGVQIHNAKPYHGQSKPIERGFRDFCDRIAKHPACEGAYTGNSPLAKPENYGHRAVPWEEFAALVDKEIALHNARKDRRTEMAKGRSFDETFAESYERCGIRKATEQQLRFALLAAENKLLNRTNGEIELHGNRYWHPELSVLKGEKVTVRFDPDNLHSDVHVYDLEGHHITAAPLLVDSGFADVAGAKEANKRVADYRRLTREKEKSEDLVSAEALALLQAGVQPETKPEAGVVRPVRHRGADEQRKAKSKKSEGTSALDRMTAGFVKRAANNH